MIPDKNKRARPFGGARREFVAYVVQQTHSKAISLQSIRSGSPGRLELPLVCQIFQTVSWPLGEFIDVIKQVQSRIVSQQGRSVRHLQALSRAGICNLDVECKILVFSGGCGNDPLGNPSDGYRHDNRTFPGSYREDVSA